jgi:hypothetical protein
MCAVPRVARQLVTTLDHIRASRLPSGGVDPVTTTITRYGDTFTIYEKIWNAITADLTIMSNDLANFGEGLRWGAHSALTTLANLPGGLAAAGTVLLNTTQQTEIQIVVTDDHDNPLSAPYSIPIPGQSPFQRCVDDPPASGNYPLPRSTIRFIESHPSFISGPRSLDRLPLNWSTLCGGPCPPAAPDLLHLRDLQDARDRAVRALQRAYERLDRMMVPNPLVDRGADSAMALNYLRCQFPFSAFGGFDPSVADAIQILGNLQTAKNALSAMNIGPSPLARIQFIPNIRSSIYATPGNPFYLNFVNSALDPDHPPEALSILYSDAGFSTMTPLPANERWIAVFPPFLYGTAQQRARTLVHESFHIIDPSIVDMGPDLRVSYNYERLVGALAELHDSLHPGTYSSAAREECDCGEPTGALGYVRCP